MVNFKVIPIAKELVDSVRLNMKDDFGQLAEGYVAGEVSYGPCRSCLKQFKPGEKRILFSYAPLPSKTPYNETGPIYIHLDHCEHYSDNDHFPQEIKAGRIHIPLSLRSYNIERRMIDSEMVSNREVEMVIASLFQNPETEVIQVRNAEAGCFIANITRE